MSVFDITRVVTQTEHIYDRDRSKNLVNLVKWLHEHVGPFYGSGEDHTAEDADNNGSGLSVIRIGNGWEISREWKGDPHGYVEVWWKLDITDDAKATLFALKWMN